MPVHENSRAELHAKLDEILGSKNATTLMDYLPRTKWYELIEEESARRLRRMNFQSKLMAVGVVGGSIVLTIVVIIDALSKAGAS